MEKRTVELLLYMGDSDSIIKWLNEEGCKTQEEAIDMLKPLVNKNQVDIASQVGQLNQGANAGPMISVINSVIETFKTN